MTLKNWKNGPQKLLIIGPDPFMPQSSQAIAHSPESIFDIMKSRDQTYLYKFIYVSETQQKISLRAGEHRGYVNRSDTNQPTGQHVTQPGHKTSDINKYQSIEYGAKHTRKKIMWPC